MTETNQAATTTSSSPSDLNPKMGQMKWVGEHGDLVFDLCQSVLWSQPNAKIAFRQIIRQVAATKNSAQYVRYERLWIMRLTVETLRKVAHRYGRKLSASERMMLDASLDVEGRIRQFDSYFHRLETDDQILLLLRDKYAMSFTEIAAIMQMPEGSLQIKRQQAMRVLEEMLWQTT